VALDLPNEHRPETLTWAEIGHSFNRTRYDILSVYSLEIIQVRKLKYREIVPFECKRSASKFYNWLRTASSFETSSRFKRNLYCNTYLYFDMSRSDKYLMHSNWVLLNIYHRNILLIRYIFGFFMPHVFVQICDLNRRSKI
jgi:hypothetical protein